MKTHNVKRLPLKEWAYMDDLRREMEEQAQEGNLRGVTDIVHKIIALSTGETPSNDFWLDDMELFVKALEANAPRKPFPILTSKTKGKPLPWEYAGRTWYFWLNVFARKYGWSETEIAVMDIDDCIGLYQEIVADDHFEKEWQNSLSEVSYQYNTATKTSKLVELPRPDWMRPTPNKSQTVKTSMMPANAVPQGVVINLDEQQPKKVESNEGTPSQET